MVLLLVSTPFILISVDTLITMLLQVFTGTTPKLLSSTLISQFDANTVSANGSNYARLIAALTTEFNLDGEDSFYAFLEKIDNNVLSIESNLSNFPSILGLRNWMVATGKTVEDMMSYLSTSSPTSPNIYIDWVNLQNVVPFLTPGQYIDASSSSVLREVASHLSTFNRNYSHLVDKIEEINSTTSETGSLWFNFFQTGPDWSLFEGTSDELEAMKGQFQSALSTYNTLNTSFQIFEEAAYSYDNSLANALGTTRSTYINLIIHNEYGVGLSAITDCSPASAHNALPKILYGYVSGDPNVAD
jgi:hypothetical protein